MASKSEILKEIEDSPVKSFTKDIVKAYITRVDAVRGKPSKLKTGDVFVWVLNGNKKRPVVIVSIKGGMVYGIPLSTTEDGMNMMASKSRFFGEGWFGKSLVSLREELVMNYFVGTYDNPSLVKKARLELKKLLNEVL